MSDPFVAEIKMFACNFAPRGWAFCNGQLLSISQNTALFSLLGTTFGGDGRTTLALPNLQGRGALSSGHGPGLSTRALGQTGGSETVTLTLNQMPSHRHPVNAKISGGTASPTNMVWGTAGAAKAAANFYAPAASPTVAMNPAALATIGGNQLHNNMMPYLALNICIALVGVYPPRS